jgi:hypothetical protein
MACTCTAQLRGGGLQVGVLGRVGRGGLPLLHRPAGGQVAVDQVVGRGLVGHDVRPRRRRPCAHQLGQDLGGIAQQGDRDGLLLGGVAGDAGQRVVQVGGLLVHVAGLQAEVDARLLALDVERAGAGEGGGQRLGAAHAAQAGGQDPACPAAPP